jgi:Sec-independent protein secretion pathway component TatC
MNSNIKTMGIDMKVLLSTLWIFVLLNVIFRDIHEFISPGFIQELMAGTVNGIQISEELLFLGGIMVEVPIAMVLLSRILQYRVNRWANMIAGVFTILVVFSNVPTDFDDIFFEIIEVVSLLLIVWFAWKWPKQEA